MNLDEYRNRFTVPASDVGQGQAAKRIRRELGNDERMDLRWDALALRWILYYDPTMSKRYIVKIWQPCIDIGGRVIADMRRLQKSRYEQQKMAQDFQNRQTRESDNQIAELAKVTASEISKSQRGLVTTSAISR